MLHVTLDLSLNIVLLFRLIILTSLGTLVVIPWIIGVQRIIQWLNESEDRDDKATKSLE